MSQSWEEMESAQTLLPVRIAARDELSGWKSVGSRMIALSLTQAMRLLFGDYELLSTPTNRLGWSKTVGMYLAGCD